MDIEKEHTFELCRAVQRQASNEHEAGHGEAERTGGTGGTIQAFE